MNRKKIILIVLILVLIFGLSVIWPRQKPKPAAAPSAQTKPTATQEAPEKKSEELEVNRPTAEGRLIDPFALRISVRHKVTEKPSVGAQEGATNVSPPTEPQLEGIWVDSNMRVAFISGQSLNIGDSVLGWQVVSITRDQVELRKDSRTKILRLEGK